MPPTPERLKATTLKCSTSIYLTRRYYGITQVSLVIEAKQGQSDFTKVAMIPGLDFGYFLPAKGKRYTVRVLALNLNGYLSFLPTR